jgi:hypothetical protein
MRSSFFPEERMQPSTLRAFATLVTALAAAGCASDTTSPRGPVLIQVAPSSRIAQVASPGSAVAIAPAVTVERDGFPQINVRVRFVVTLGGGRVAGAVATTDVNGVASAGRWTLGAEGANEVLASIDGGPSLAFGGYAVNLPTGGDAYDLVSQNGQPLPADPGYFSGCVCYATSPYKDIAGRLILGADSNYSAVIIQYNSTERTFGVRHYAGAYARTGVTLTLAAYADTDSATGAFQTDLLAIHAVVDWGADTAPFVTDDLYRRVGY